MINYICEYCNKDFKNRRSLSSHLTNNPCKQYYINKYKKSKQFPFRIKKCLDCGIIISDNKTNKRCNSCAQKICDYNYLPLRQRLGKDGYKKWLDNKNKLKGKTWEELYGKEQSIEMKIPFKQKRGTFEERFGKEKADIIKKKISKSQKGNTHTRYNLKKLQIKYPLFCIIEKPEEDKNGIKCKCKKCGVWFYPLHDSIYLRAATLRDNKDLNNLYCSDKCKNNCEIFGKKITELLPKNEDLWFTNVEYQTFRQQVLKRENYKCEYCEKLATHVHHEKPQKTHPHLSIDPDNGIAACEKCHFKYGHPTGTECSNGNIAKKICK